MSGLLRAGSSAAGGGGGGSKARKQGLSRRMISDIACWRVLECMEWKLPLQRFGSWAFIICAPTSLAEGQNR